MKNKEEIIQEIHKLAKKISETDSEDTLLESARELYEKSVLLKHLAAIPQVSPDTASPVIVKQEEKIIPEKESIKPEPSQKDTLSKESTNDQSAITGKKQVAIDLFSSEPIPAEISPEPVPEKPAPKEPKTEKKKSEENIGEKLLRKESFPKESMIGQHKKITDLKASIGINEKFQFINELFEGNMKEYNVAIDQINNFSSYSETESYIANLQEVYKWKEDNFITLNFLELVRRRFL